MGSVEVDSVGLYMTSLSRRTLQGFDPRWPDIDQVGGLFIIPPDLSAEEIRFELGEGAVRAVEMHGKDLTPLADFPVEFLFANWPNVDAAPVNHMTRLRGLSIDSWRGDLMISRLRHLEWFGVVEVGHGQLDELFDNGHPTLRLLSAGKYREPDLLPLEHLGGLMSLAVVDSRSLTTLDGLGALPRLLSLDLTTCPGLATLAGIEQAKTLQAVTLESCNKVDDISPLADLHDLRVVQIEMRSTPSLAPLAGHPSLEYLWVIGRKPPSDQIEALLDTPSLRMIMTGPASWLRLSTGWEHFADASAMSEDVLQLRERGITALNALKYQ